MPWQAMQWTYSVFAGTKSVIDVWRPFR